MENRNLFFFLREEARITCNLHKFARHSDLVSRQGLPQWSVPAFSLLFARVAVTSFAGTMDSGINIKMHTGVHTLEHISGSQAYHIASVSLELLFQALRQMTVHQLLF